LINSRRLILIASVSLERAIVADLTRTSEWVAIATELVLRNERSRCAIMYGPAVRTRWTFKIDERESCINVSDL
jgi:hypothetical protein